MNLHRPAATLMAAAALLLCIPAHASAADGTEQRKKVVTCLNAEMEKENTARRGDGHLTDVQLKALERIVDAEVMNGPLEKTSSDEQMKLLKRIENAARQDKDLQAVPTATIDKILIELREKGMYCESQK